MQTAQQPIELRTQPHSFLPQQPVAIQAILEKCTNDEEFTEEEAALVAAKPWLFMFYTGFTARYAPTDSAFAPAINVEHRLQTAA